MTRWLVLGLVLLLPALGTGQTQTQNVSQIAARADAATRVSTSATTATTLTLDPRNGLPGAFVYIYEIDIQNCAGASAVTAAAVTTVTTTNIDGGLAFTVGSGVGAGLCTEQSVTYPTGLKSQAPSIPVTVVLPAFATNQTIRVNVIWRTAL